MIVVAPPRFLIGKPGGESSAPSAHNRPRGRSATTAWPRSGLLTWRPVRHQVAHRIEITGLRLPLRRLAAGFGAFHNTLDGLVRGAAQLGGTTVVPRA